jgi:hypothetical protein
MDAGTSLDGGMEADGGGNPNPDGGSMNMDAGGYEDSGMPPSDGGTTKPDAGHMPPPTVTCPAPIMPADVSHPTTVVGTGPGTCTQQALAAALAQGGIITFNCGPSATIPLTAQLELSTTVNTVIDGGGQVTLDGQGMTRILHFGMICQPQTQVTVTVQHITLTRGHATGHAIPPLPSGAPAYCSQGFFNDGSGGAIWMRGAALRVIDSTFTNNSGGATGPDLAGGAIYALGAPELTIVGSTFNGNSAANGGAIGSLNSILTLINDTFVQNSATGSGANAEDMACPSIMPPWPCGLNHPETGSGGDGGAVLIDGGLDGAVTICGSTFSGNRAGALGGALFRTVDSATRKATNIDRCTFDGNIDADGDPADPRFTNTIGGGVLYSYQTDLTVTNTTFSNNSAGVGGALLPSFGALNLTNVTFSGNHSTKGPGGAIRLINGMGNLLNCTFADNHVDIPPANAAPNLPAQGAALAGGLFDVSNSIFSDNSTLDPAKPMTCVLNVMGEYDLQWPMDHTVGGQPDSPCVSGIKFADPLLGELQNNGGSTSTMLPGAGSPAIGAGHGCPATDQRGNMRRPDGCTAGAVEVP